MIPAKLPNASSRLSMSATRNHENEGVDVKLCGHLSLGGILQGMSGVETSTASGATPGKPPEHLGRGFILIWQDPSTVRPS